MIEYLTGDATRPRATPKTKIIAHVCNDAGGWGRGFVTALSRRYIGAEEAYREWHRGVRGAASSYESKTTGKFALGESQLVYVEGSMMVRGLVTAGGVHICNMVAQEGFGPSTEPRIRYPALALCLRHLDDWATELDAEVHMPRIGCGLGGGRWERVMALVERLVSAPVFVYDLPA